MLWIVSMWIHSPCALVVSERPFIGWMDFRGTPLCEHADFFLNTKRLLIFLITPNCLPKESAHNELFFLILPVSLSVPLTSSHFLPVSLSMSHIAGSFQGLFIPLAKIGKEHCSNQACWTQIRTAHWKIFHWLATVWMGSKSRNILFFSYLIIDLITNLIVSG